MYQNTLFDKVRRGETAFGFSVNFGNPGAIELIAPGWDYIWLDQQHGQLSYDSLLNCCIAARAAGVETVLRAPGHDYSVLGPLADLCPAAVMAPMVNDKKEAQAIVRCLRFPPQGVRSYWNSRMISIVGDRYNERVDLMVIVQIETAQGLGNVGEIATTPGIDCLMFGPSDLSLSLGLRMGDSWGNHPQMEEAAKKMIAAAKEAGKYSMFIAGNPQEAAQLREMGVNIIVCGSDTGFLSAGATNTLKALRGI